MMLITGTHNAHKCTNPNRGDPKAFAISGKLIGRDYYGVFPKGKLNCEMFHQELLKNDEINLWNFVR